MRVVRNVEDQTQCCGFLIKRPLQILAAIPKEGEFLCLKKKQANKQNALIDKCTKIVSRGFRLTIITKNDQNIGSCQL